MIEILPKYEVLYSDLRIHNIGSFLTSREFKVFMTENGYFDRWKSLYEQVKSNRRYLSLYIDHESGDTLDTFAMYLNVIPEEEIVEIIVTLIISKFIEYKKEKTDFSDILQSMKIAKFKEKNIKIVSDTIEKHNKKDFPKEENKQIKQKIKISKDEINTNEIFIVHGHNEEMKQTVARVLERLKLRPIILNEQSNEGLTIIEKLEKYSNVPFAIILLTYDDFGNSKSSINRNKRARQNVILELGYFIAKLGRQNVFPLYEDEVELPSDISGILYTKIDKSEKWKTSLVKELKTAGFKVNANDIL